MAEVWSADLSKFWSLEFGQRTLRNFLKFLKFRSADLCETDASKQCVTFLNLALGNPGAWCLLFLQAV